MDGVEAPLMPLLTRLRELLHEILPRFGLRPWPGQEGSAGIHPEELKEIGTSIPLGPRASIMEVRAPGGGRWFLKKWHDLPPESRRDLARNITERKRLEGPDFLRLIDCGERSLDRLAGYVFAVQEYRPRNLARYLQDLGGPCPLDEGARIIRSVARALARGHAANLAHGNLSPEAVYLGTEEGPAAGDVALDYVRFSGLEGAPDAAITLMDLYPSGRGYLPPEAFMGEPLDEMSDLFTLGIMAYEVFTGHIPFDPGGASTTQRVKAMLEARAEPPGRLRRDLPNRWEAAILQLLRKERRQRYPSVEQFLDDVGKTL